MLYNETPRIRLPNKVGFDLFWRKENVMKNLTYFEKKENLNYQHGISLFNGGLDSLSSIAVLFPFHGLVNEVWNFSSSYVFSDLIFFGFSLSGWICLCILFLALARFW